MMKRGRSQTTQPAATVTEPAKTKRSRAEWAVAAQFMSMLKAGADTRTKKVKRIRQSVRSRSYENDLKLSIALDRLSRELSA